jgi:hypothetical protein
MKVFIDSNIFINFLTDSEDSDKAYRLMKRKEYISKRDYEEIRKYLEKFMGMLDKLSCEILGTNGEAAFLLEIMTNYNLLPNDALIAATCKHCGITKIATFDEDFKRVDFLEMIELED